MKTIEIKGSTRTDLGKKATKALRKNGNVPCIIYGGKENINFFANEADFKHLVYTPEVYLVKIDVDGKVVTAAMKEIQFHPVSDAIQHIDFLQVFEDKALEINIPVKIVGSSIGVKKGGKLSLAKRHLRVKALPKFLPDFLEINIDTLDVGQSIKVGNLSFNNINVLNGDREPVVSILTSRLTAKASTEEAAK